MTNPCRCWNQPLEAPLMPHEGHCCLREDTTPCLDIGPTTPTSCGHFVADSVIGRAQAAHHGGEK